MLLVFIGEQDISKIGVSSDREHKVRPVREGGRLEAEQTRRLTGYVIIAEPRSRLAVDN